MSKTGKKLVNRLLAEGFVEVILNEEASEAGMMSGAALGGLAGAGLGVYTGAKIGKSVVGSFFDHRVKFLKDKAKRLREKGKIEEAEDAEAEAEYVKRSGRNPKIIAAILSAIAMGIPLSKVFAGLGLLAGGVIGGAVGPK